MAFNLARSAFRSSMRMTPAVWRPAVSPAMSVPRARSYVTLMDYSRQEVVDKLDTLHSEVLSTNWADYLNLVYSVPFWNLEYTKLSTITRPYMHDAVVGEKFDELQELFDVLYQCEDVRDHINELSEIYTRASGVLGTGYMPGEKVDNMDEHVALLDAAYNEIIESHPDFKPKIEQTVGHGLAGLRSQYKFHFSGVHRYHF